MITSSLLYTTLFTQWSTSFASTYSATMLVCSFNIRNKWQGGLISTYRQYPMSYRIALNDLPLLVCCSFNDTTHLFLNRLIRITIGSNHQARIRHKISPMSSESNKLLRTTAIIPKVRYVTSIPMIISIVFL